METVFEKLYSYLTGSSSKNISVYRFERILLIISCCIIQYTNWSIFTGYTPVFPDIPELFLLHLNYGASVKKVYICSIVAAVLICLLRNIIFKCQLDEKVTAGIYTWIDIIKILYCILLLRFALSICMLAKSGTIKEVDYIIVVATFVYLFIYVIAGNIYESWLAIVTISIDKPAIFADRDGNPIYENDYISYKGKIYRVVTIPTANPVGENDWAVWTAIRINSRETIQLSNIMNEDSNGVIKIKGGLYKRI